MTLLDALGNVARAAKQWQDRFYDDREGHLRDALDEALSEPSVVAYLERTSKETSHARNS
jgi:hypothetical protein